MDSAAFVSSPKEKNRGPPTWRSSRLQLVYMIASGMIVLFYQRVSFSMAIVCMVNHTALDTGRQASHLTACARDQYAYMQTGLIGKMFSCTPAGSYQRYACQGSVCFCADTLGNMQSGSPSVNIGNIGSLQC